MKNAVSEPLITIDKVSKSFLLGDSLVQALRDVSLQLAAGGICALMGPSGSGKSTLLNLVGALDRPTGGRVFVKGQDLATFSKDEQAGFRNTTIGFVFQNFNLIPVFTALENVLLPFQLSRKPFDRSVHERAYGLLAKVELSDQAHQKANQLSGGQMQRVAIARALMNRPEIILADEPTANLDTDTADTVLNIFKSACASEGATALIATHDHAVLRFCSRVVSLRDGHLIKDEMLY